MSAELPAERGALGGLVIHHLGWVVDSIEDHHAHFGGQLGLPYEGVESFPNLQVGFYRVGSCLIELLEPTGDDDTADFLRTRGEGIHHIAYRVDDVADALEAAKDRGLTALDDHPRPGARGTSIAFVDPGRDDHILVEFVEEPT